MGREEGREGGRREESELEVWRSTTREGRGRDSRLIFFFFSLGSELEERVQMRKIDIVSKANQNAF